MRVARGLLDDEEVAELEDVDAAIARAVDTYRAFAGRDDVRALLSSGERLHEVPFSFVRDGHVQRGTIDCLVVAPDDGSGPRVTVVEFKTGRRRPEHQHQLDAYVDAARALFPHARVEGVLLYR